jgi:hypothetical protein
MTGISGKSDSQRFRTGGISPYCLSLPPGSAIFRNDRLFCVIEYAKTNSWTSVQRAFRKWFRTDPPPQASIQRWFDNFENRGCICKKKSSDRCRVSDEAVRQVEATFSRSPRKSVRKGSRELQMSKMTVWQVLSRRVRVKPYNAMLRK